MVCIESINSEYQEGRGWKIVQAIERAKVIVLIVIFDGFGELGLVCTIDAARVNRINQNSFETY